MITSVLDLFKYFGLIYNSDRPVSNNAIRLGEHLNSKYDWEPTVRLLQDRVEFGATLEGCEEEIKGTPLMYPFTEVQLESLMEGIEDQEDVLWVRHKTQVQAQPTP